MNKIGILETSQDVVERLIDIDEEIGEFGNDLGYKVGFVIFGGTALLLYNNPKMTNDIDVILLNSEDLNFSKIKDVFEKYTVRPNPGIMQYPYTKDITSRMRPIMADFKNIDVYVTSKEDLVLSKLFSSRAEDEYDLIHTEIMDQADMDIVRYRYEEYLPMYIGGMGEPPNLDNLIKWREEEKQRIKKEQNVL